MPGTSVEDIQDKLKKKEEKKTMQRKKKFYFSIYQEEVSGPRVDRVVSRCFWGLRQIWTWGPFSSPQIVGEGLEGDFDNSIIAGFGHSIYGDDVTITKLPLM